MYNSWNKIIITKCNGKIEVKVKGVTVKWMHIHVILHQFRYLTVFSIRSIDGTCMDVFWARYMSSDDYVLELKVEGENEANAADNKSVY